MAQDNRVIVNAVRMPGVKEEKRFTKGALITDPDELVASGADLQALYDAGAITGTWKGVKTGSEATEATEPKASKKGK
jgi:hypothetical protein